MLATPIPTPTLVTAPTEEPVSLDEMKLYLRVVVADDDSLIRGLIQAAREWLSAALDRQLVTATWRLKLPDFWGTTLEVPYPPLISVGSITYLDTAGVSQTLSSSYYVVQVTTTPGRIVLADGYYWPAVDIHPEAVTVNFTAGYGAASAVPELAKIALKLLVQHWYDHPEERTQIPNVVDSMVTSLRAYRF